MKFRYAVLAAFALAACRHHQQAVKPAVAPQQVATAPAPAPVVKVAAPDTEFKQPFVQTEDLGDAAHATQLADQKGWLRDAYFDFASEHLRDDARTNLGDSASWLRQHPKFNVLVEGHCDERGTEQYNLALGERRAYEAKEYLAVIGIDPAHIATISYGKDRPFDAGHDEEAWAKNRRAHLVLTAAR